MHILDGLLHPGTSCPCYGYIVSPSDACPLRHPHDTTGESTRPALAFLTRLGYFWDAIPLYAPPFDAVPLYPIAFWGGSGRFCRIDRCRLVVNHNSFNNDPVSGEDNPVE